MFDRSSSRRAAVVSNVKNLIDRSARPGALIGGEIRADRARTFEPPAGAAKALPALATAIDAPPLLRGEFTPTRGERIACGAFLSSEVEMLEFRE
jgi:hypothetical protein